MIYNITPVTKPRMTQRDKWKKRPCVVKYFAFKDKCRAADMEIQEEGSFIIFNIPMPKSWSKRKKDRMRMMRHRQRPDIDNLLKAVFDALYDEDCHIWDIRARKLWSDFGSIEIGHKHNTP